MICPIYYMHSSECPHCIKSNTERLIKKEMTVNKNKEETCKKENKIGELLNQLQRIRKQAGRIDGCSANYDISHEIDSICTDLEVEIEKGIVNFYGLA
jgi:hypothetical protein